MEENKIQVEEIIQLKENLPLFIFTVSKTRTAPTSRCFEIPA